MADKLYIMFKISPILYQTHTHTLISVQLCDNGEEKHMEWAFINSFHEKVEY
jgi:hypothetical protein